MVNTVKDSAEIAGNRPIRAIIGGLHLLNASAGRMNQTLEAFRRWNIQQIIPGHCTGVAAAAQLWTAFPERCSPCTTGSQWVFK